MSACHLFHIVQGVPYFVMYVQNINMYGLMESHISVIICFRIISMDSVLLWNHNFHLEKFRNINIMKYYISNRNIHSMHNFHHYHAFSLYHYYGLYDHHLLRVHHTPLHMHRIDKAFLDLMMICRCEYL